MMWLVGLALCGFYLSFVGVICFPVSFDTTRDLASRYVTHLVQVMCGGYLDKVWKAVISFLSDWF